LIRISTRRKRDKTNGDDRERYQRGNRTQMVSYREKFGKSQRDRRREDEKEM